MAPRDNASVHTIDINNTVNGVQMTLSYLRSIMFPGSTTSPPKKFKGSDRSTSLVATHGTIWWKNLVLSTMGRKLKITGGNKSELTWMNLFSKKR